MTVPCGVVVPTLQSVWLGVPGAMAALPIPDPVSSGGLTRGDNDHDLVNGGTTTTKRPSVKRQYPLSWSQLSQDDADVLVAYYAGVMGRGPFVFVDPRWRNLLDNDTSTMLGSVGAVRAWATSTLDPDPVAETVIAPPAGVRSGVLRWPDPGIGDVLWAGAVDDSGTYTVDGRRPPPNLGLAGWLSVWVRLDAAQANVTATLRANGVPASRTWTGLFVAGAATTLTTTWQRLTVAYATLGNQAAAPLITPSIVVNGAGLGSVDVLVAGAQLTVEPTTAGAAKAQPFNVGLGCPRVTVGAGMGDQSSVWWRKSHTLNLNEN